MTELYKFTKPEPAIREIDRRLAEAMKPKNGDLIARLRQYIATRGKTPKQEM